MSTSVDTTSRAELRAEAQRHLVLLAGATAELRDDQWLAIEALVSEHRKALVVQRTGWGKSAVYFPLDHLAPRPRSRSNSDHLPAALPHA